MNSVQQFSFVPPGQASFFFKLCFVLLLQRHSVTHSRKEHSQLYCLITWERTDPAQTKVRELTRLQRLFLNHAIRSSGPKKYLTNAYLVTFSKTLQICSVSQTSSMQPLRQTLRCMTAKIEASSALFVYE